MVPDNNTPKELVSNLDGKYWNSSLIHIYLAATTEFSKSHASIATPQYGFNKGINFLKKAGYDATVAELEENLVGRDVIRPLKNPNKGIIQKSLRYPMYLKQKMTGKVKACGCAGGRPQRDCITKEKSSAPTVSTNALILVCSIVAIQRRKVAVRDITGAFLQSDYPSDREDYLRLGCLMVDILVQIVPEYANYFSQQNGEQSY